MMYWQILTNKKLYLDCRQALLKNNLMTVCKLIWERYMEIRSRKNLLKFIVGIFEKKEKDFSKSNFRKLKLL